VSITKPNSRLRRQSAPISDAEATARQYGLIKAGGEIPLTTYIGQLWRRRYFINAFARSRIQAENARNRLGDIWLVLTPILNAAVFYLIFGVILKTDRGVENYVGFLITGVFIFTYLQRSVSGGAVSVSGQYGLIRAFHFPRAVLPLASTLKELLQLGISLLVLCVIVLITGEPLTVRWLLLPVAVAMMTVFSAGLAMIVARINTHFNDFNSFLPFMLRTWLYISGVFFSIQAFGADWPSWARDLLLIQPGAVYLECARYALLESYDAPASVWAWGAGWAVVSLIIGFVYFYRAETSYGRG
jgi:teichoic acid transport system permease protein